MTGSLAKPAPGVAATGREWTDLNEGGPISDRVHPPEPKAGNRIPARCRPSVAAQDQDQDQHHPRQRPGERRRTNLTFQFRVSFFASFGIFYSFFIHSYNEKSFDSQPLKYNG